MEEVDKEISEMKLSLNARARVVAESYLLAVSYFISMHVIALTSCHSSVREGSPSVTSTDARQSGNIVFYWSKIFYHKTNFIALGSWGTGRNRIVGSRRIIHGQMLVYGQLGAERSPRFMDRPQSELNVLPVVKQTVCS